MHFSRALMRKPRLRKVLIAGYLVAISSDIAKAQV